MDYEPALVDHLLDDLVGSAGETVWPPQLQLVCSALYDGLGTEERTIALDAYKWLGGVQGMLQRYLDYELARLESDERALAQTALKELVTSELTKAVKTDLELAAALGMEASTLTPILQKLVRAHLLRPVERTVTAEPAYEVAYEYLIGEIGRWVDPQDLARKQAEELLAREVASWRTYRTPIPRERLTLLHRHRNALRILDDDAWECLVSSALQADADVEDWTRLAGKEGEKILLAELDASSGVMRRTATRGLGAIWQHSEISRLGHEDRQIRRAAVRELGELGDARAVQPLIAALRDENWNVHRAATRALGRLGDPAVCLAR
jgi:hypothetical protein